MQQESPLQESPQQESPLQESPQQESHSQERTSKMPQARDYQKVLALTGMLFSHADFRKNKQYKKASALKKITILVFYLGYLQSSKIIIYF